jgi:hypothetical protein
MNHHKGQKPNTQEQQNREEQHHQHPNEPNHNALNAAKNAASLTRCQRLSSRHLGFERLCQVCPKVLDVLEADAEAEQAGRDARSFPTGAGLKRGRDAAEAGCVLDQRQRALHAHSVRPRLL